MTSLSQLERIIGVRKNSDFLNPKLISVKDFGFPKGVALSWTSDDAPLSTDVVLAKADSPRVFIVDSYSNGTLGKYKKIHISLNRVISERRGAEPQFEYSLHLDKMDKLPASRVSVFDYSELTMEEVDAMDDSRWKIEPPAEVVFNISENFYKTHLEFPPSNFNFDDKVNLLDNLSNTGV